ncbi:MAG: AAA family ATPase [Malacoplasma sp.]|nr:AAA family ATPase [Malacoplasma sp.]
MMQSVEEIRKLKKSINENGLTIYSGICCVNKTEIINSLIEECKKEINCIVLDFSILNYNRKYEISENIELIKEQIKPHSNSLIFILEFTNCEGWIEIINFVCNTLKNVKLFCSTSCSFSSLTSLSKAYTIKHQFNELVYYPPTVSQYFEECYEANCETYIKYGSTIYRSADEYKKIELTNQIDFFKLLSMFLILTKVRNHFYIEVFMKFLLENLDKKLTIDFTKRNIGKSTKLHIKNTKIFWKYKNLLLDLFILIPIKTITISTKTKAKNTRLQSKFICIDHMLINKLENVSNKTFLIGRNIFISEFLKRNLEVFAIEKNDEEIGLVGTLFNGKKIIFSYNPSNDDEIIHYAVGHQLKDEFDLVHFKKRISQKELANILENFVKNNIK